MLAGCEARRRFYETFPQAAARRCGGGPVSSSTPNPSRHVRRLGLPLGRLHGSSATGAEALIWFPALRFYHQRPLRLALVHRDDGPDSADANIRKLFHTAARGRRLLIQSCLNGEISEERYQRVAMLGIGGNSHHKVLRRRLDAVDEEVEDDVICRWLIHTVHHFSMRCAHLLDCCVYPISNLTIAHFEPLAEGRSAVWTIFERPVVNVPENEGFPVSWIGHRLKIPQCASSLFLCLCEQLLYRVRCL